MKEMSGERRRWEIARRRAIMTMVFFTIAFSIGAGYCINRFLIVPQKNYQHAKQLLKEERYTEASAAFGAIGNYRDSKKMIKKCQYQLGLKMIEENNYDEAVLLFSKIGSYRESDDMVLEAKYLKAKTMYAYGYYGEAYDLFYEIGNYKDAEKLINEDKHLIAVIDHRQWGEQFEFLKTVGFGNYAGEPILWTVRAIEGDKRLLISKYAIEAMAYNEEYNNVTWETSGVRDWLNNTFYESSFNNDEKRMILKSNVENPNNPKFGTIGGDNTEDYVFLLSYKEARSYFLSPDDKEDSTRVASATSHAEQKGVYIGRSGTTDSPSFGCGWLLRTPGSEQNKVAYVNIDGSINLSGTGVIGDKAAIRPAIWVSVGDLNAQEDSPAVCLSEIAPSEFERYIGNEGDSCIYNLDMNGLPGPSNEYHRNGNAGVDGTIYTDGFEIWLARWNKKEEASWVSAVFPLEENYRLLTGKCGLIRSYNTTAFHTTLSFFDGDNLLNSVTLTPENCNKQFYVNVEGVKDLRIIAEDDIETIGGTSFAIHDCYLFECKDCQRDLALEEIDGTSENNMKRMNLTSFSSDPFNQKYWIIFTEGSRSNRIEAATFNSDWMEDDVYITWDSYLETECLSDSEHCEQFCYMGNGNWEKIGQYNRLSDYVTGVIASSVNVYNSKGELILNGRNYDDVDFDKMIIQ